MAWNISEEGKTMKVEIDGRLVAAVAPSLREEILGKGRRWEGRACIAAARTQDRVRHHEGEQSVRDRPDGRGREVLKFKV